MLWFHLGEKINATLHIFIYCHAQAVLLRKVQWYSEVFFMQRCRSSLGEMSLFSVVFSHNTFAAITSVVMNVSIHCKLVYAHTKVGGVNEITTTQYFLSEKKKKFEYEWSSSTFHIGGDKHEQHYYFSKPFFSLVSIVRHYGIIRKHAHSLLAKNCKYYYFWNMRTACGVINADHATTDHLFFEPHKFISVGATLIWTLNVAHSRTYTHTHTCGVHSKI